ncbi:MAG: hypothetical protein D6741_01455 [Planctomycetota bacterium]|nr:MAG: hypothetical protein D6741_01455 [Planctomycetota bacterium]
MIRKRKPRDKQQPGYDSFLDIVTNIVGILIILVMVVGVRVKHAPLLSITPRQSPPQALIEELSAKKARVDSLRNEIAAIATQIEAIERERVVRQFEREQLVALKLALEEKLGEVRASLDARSRRRMELEARIAEAKRKADDLLRERAALDEVAQPIEIRHRITPLGKKVEHETEIHFRLENGRITFIPLDELLEELVDDARTRVPNLLRMPEITATVGPIGGYRLRYTLGRQSATPEDRWSAGPVGGGRVELKRWVLIPSGTVTGETVDEALKETSMFRRRLAGYDPKTTVVTIWVYPEDFGNFRKVRDVIHELGFAAAARPLPRGFPISGAPDGSKSMAE